MIILFLKQPALTSVESEESDKLVNSVPHHSQWVNYSQPYFAQFLVKKTSTNITSIYSDHQMSSNSILGNNTKQSWCPMFSINW